MKFGTYIVLGIALLGADALQATYAATAPQNNTYYPAGQSEQVVASTASREQVRDDVLVANQTRRTTWTEFGAGSHDNSLSTQTRAQVKSQAESVEHPEQRSYFNY
jgi:hypothetical protein